MGSNMAEKWEELSGKNNWDGLLNPLDVDLRRYTIRYGRIGSRPKVFGDGGLLSLTQPLVHHGFYNIYTSDSERSQFLIKTSARDQVLKEVKRLVEEYKHEEVSITVAGHSLGASLATLNAVDIAYNGINKTSSGKEFPVTAFVFASPKVGELNFVNAFNKLKHLHILRIHNLLDILNPGDPHTRHNLEGYLHGIDGTQGADVLSGFKLEVNRDLALVNRIWDILKDEYLIPGAWWVEKNKGMVQQEDGKWVLNDREDYDIIVEEL
ncbi:hypothetical protein HAX54_012421 [Datura stramonium]|uniref:Phospholipase A1 n=1 Tax=Datura stramonium TaxID=4076 RepID=A0ABS8TLG7_DATST|nr:hypothetical protein [Datura stramonium]